MLKHSATTRISVGEHLRPLSSVLLFLLFIDAVLIALFLRWAYVAHHELTESVIYGRSIFSLNEGGLTELWGHAKLAAAVGLIWLVSRVRNPAYYRAIAAAMLVMLLSDSLQLHKRLVRLVINFGGFSGQAEPLIDPVIKLALIVTPATAAVLAFWRLPEQDRGLAALAAAPLLLLGFCAGVMDFFHVMATRYLQGGRTIASLIEEGGEGLVATAVLVTAIFIHARVRGRDQVSALSRSPI